MSDLQEVLESKSPAVQNREDRYLASAFCVNFDFEYSENTETAGYKTRNSNETDYFAKPYFGRKTEQVKAKVR